MNEFLIEISQLTGFFCADTYNGDLFLENYTELDTLWVMEG